MRYSVKRAVAQDGFDLVAFRRSTALEGMNHGHGGLAFSQVAGHRLA